jgi:hypothetical protein
LHQKGKKIAGLSSGCVSALIAQPAHHEMLEVNLEAIFFNQSALDRQEQLFIAGDASAAFFTRQVMVMPFFGMVIDGMPVQFAFKDAIVFFQHFQCPVNRRFIDVRIFFMNEVDDFLGCNVPAPVMNEIKYHPARLRDPHSLLL